MCTSVNSPAAGRPALSALRGLVVHLYTIANILGKKEGGEEEASRIVYTSVNSPTRMLLSTIAVWNACLLSSVVLLLLITTVT